MSKLTFIVSVTIGWLSGTGIILLTKNFSASICLGVAIYLFAFLMAPINSGREKE